MDGDLRRRVDLFLQQKGVSSLPRLNIEVEGGQVTLQGTASSFYGVLSGSVQSFFSGPFGG